MNTRTVAYANQATRPMTVSSGDSHQRSVRKVFSEIAARGRGTAAPADGGRAVVVVIFVFAP